MPGAFTYVSVFAVGVVALFPGMLLAVGAGVAFDSYPVAVLVVWLGSSIGCVTAFIVGRFF